MPRILFVSGSFGLGHVTRDLAIAQALRAAAPGIEIAWMAGEPARTFLVDAGEPLLAAGAAYQSDTVPAESAASGGGVNLFRYLMRARGLWARNWKLFADVVARERFDAVVADEVYEVAVALIQRKFEMPAPLVMIYDFMGLDAMTPGRFERLGVQFWNWMWSRDAEILRSGRHRALFVGEPEDIPDRPLGWRLPNRREHARRNYHFLGYVLPPDLAEVGDRARVRAELGYPDGPLVVASIGGTAIGKNLLLACGRAFPIARRSVPALQMLLVCGPRLHPAALDVPPGVQTAGFVPQLYRHLAASDLAIVQAGGTTTLELTALRRPFVYVPMEGQCEQEIVVAGRLARHRAGIRLPWAEASPERLAELIVGNIGKEATWPNIPVDGARAAARHVLAAIDGSSAPASPSDPRSSRPAAQ
jgi:UDP-N-acetylglucosamine:LPS N-acetylglucosamine transferase